MSIEDFIIWLYCCVDDYIKEIPQAIKLRSRGFSPSLDDAEVITRELAGEFLGIETDKGIWRYFHQHWKALFPSLGSRSNFARQASNLLQLKQMIQEKALSASGSSDEELPIIDGFPIPICHFRRARGCKNFREVEQASYGFCASKQERYSGFEGHIVITKTGMITGFALTKPHIEREASFECTNTIEGLLLGDKGYTGENYSEELKLEGIQISTPSKKNGEDKETPAFRK